MKIPTQLSIPPPARSKSVRLLDRWRPSHWFIRWSSLFLLVLTSIPLARALEVARPFAPHMVLPAGRAVVMTGTAAAGVAVTVRVADKPVRTTAAADGVWSVTLPAVPVSTTAMTITVEAGAETLVIDDVLAGEVWMASGQSNMDFPLAKAIGGKAAVAAAGVPGMRLCSLTAPATSARAFPAAERARLTPAGMFSGTWQPSTAATAAEFSAVAWWAGKLRHERTGIPIGIIENAVGGSGTEAWVPPAWLARDPATAGLAGMDWLEHPKLSPWARGRAKQNLGDAGGVIHPFMPGVLFTAGVAWWRGFPLDGVLWYQGETNAERNDADWNGRLLRGVVSGWREALAQPDLPFHIVQLPRIGGTDPIRKFWPEYRAVQQSVATALPHTRLIITSDLGWDSPDVHPPDKLPVARRVEQSMSLPR